MRIDDLTKSAIQHTLHCLLGCSIGEILGMAISTALGWSNLVNIFLAVALAFFFGYLLTIRSLYRKNIKGQEAVKTALATDSASTTTMELIDNLFIIAVPGAINAELNSSLFWWSLLIGLAVAFVVTVPVNRFVMAKSGSHHH